MKYMLMCAAALIVCFGIAWLAARWIGKRAGMSRAKTGGLTLLLGVVLLGGVSLAYLSDYYPADMAALEQALDASPVTMEKIDGGYRFDGPGTDTALVFYPGAKVDTLAYGPLMVSLAQEGVDCFLADMPFHMAMFGSNRAEAFQNRYPYASWLAAGHSMGGLVISGYAASHPERIDDLILLAAYPGKAIPESVRFCSIYGTQDGCLNLEAYQSARAYWPADSAEFILSGGNHAQYANYGPQSGDGLPEVSVQEQQRQTAEIILNRIR